MTKTQIRLLDALRQFVIFARALGQCEYERRFNALLIKGLRRRG
jgi:hypothetical protein